MPVFNRELGIDLGSMNTVVSEGAQVMLNEPTAVAVFMNEQIVVESGQNAKDMMGRVPESIEIFWPVQHGVIANYEITGILLKRMIQTVCGKSLLFRPRIMLTMPYGITSVEMRAVHEAGLDAGSRDVHLVSQPLAAALGIDLPISSPSGNMILLMGGGTNQVAVLAMNDVVTAETARTGGARMDEAIVAYARRKYGIIIGMPTAEALKIRVGAAAVEGEVLSMEVQGQDQVSGMPRPVTMNTVDIAEALQDPLNELVGLVKRVLEKTPPELISDIVDRGMALCGGGSMLRGLERYMTKSLGIPTYLVDNPTTCVSIGASKALTMREILRRSLPAL